jgi:ubiquinone/menaquinone biosynthesis C-methylase UbiE
MDASAFPTARTWSESGRNLDLMATSPSPLATPAPWNLISSAYDADLRAQFERYSADALRLARVAPGQTVADVATGPGTLALLAAGMGARVHALDFAEDMVALTRARIARDAAEGIDVVLGDGMALPWSDASFDAAFSMFGLMFFPDRSRGFRELGRVVRSGGRAVIATWTPLEEVPFFKEVFAKLQAELPHVPFGASKMPLTDPDELRDEMASAGFREVVVHRVVHTEPPSTVDAMWERMGRSMAPLVLLRRGLGEEAWERLGDAMRARLVECFGAEPEPVALAANLGVGMR